MADKEPKQWEINLLARLPRPVAVMLIAAGHGLYEAVPLLIAAALLIAIVSVFLFVAFHFGGLRAIILVIIVLCGIRLYDVYAKHSARLPRREKKNKE